MSRSIPSEYIHEDHVEPVLIALEREAHALRERLGMGVGAMFLGADEELRVLYRLPNGEFWVSCLYTDRFHARAVSREEARQAIEGLRPGDDEAEKLVADLNGVTPKQAEGTDEQA